ncbi:MAG TPA: YdiU family protein [Vicinamibacterales bacterium]|nr:YdiU family protein [Vicinamibacterales bacterium]
MAGWRLEHSYAALPQLFFSDVRPTPVAAPRLVIFNGALAEALGLDRAALDSPAGAATFAGNTLPDGARPIAQAYAGHQFGHFTGLGDGRAILLGEQIAPSGHRRDIQLKGSGRTPYSRGGDGRAALGPMLREFIVSEAMDALGIPTTRSLAVVATGEAVFRDAPLEGAILTRVAASHIRVGTMQRAAAHRDHDALRALSDYTRARHYPQLAEAAEPHLALFDAVVDAQARLIARWQLVGFIHGVMNTDNMALSGETIDYGPCAFMDAYDPGTVFSSIDHAGRYAYGNQPAIAHWNLTRLAEAMLPLFDAATESAVERATASLDRFPELYEQYWLDGMRSKLGLFAPDPEDSVLVEDLLAWMRRQEADFTNVFRSISRAATAAALASEDAGFAAWYARLERRRSRQPQAAAASEALMQRNNPAFIPRNHLVEEALAAAVGEHDHGVMERLLDVLARPYDYDRDLPMFTQPGKDGRHYRTFCGT